MVHLLGDVINLQGDSFLFVEIGVKFKLIPIPRLINSPNAHTSTLKPPTRQNNEHTAETCVFVLFCPPLYQKKGRKIGVPPFDFNKN